MATFQFLIMQQDNYGGFENCCREFLETLYNNFKNDKFMYIFHTEEKDLHIHCILCVDSARTKKELLEYFPKADIRVQRASNELAMKYIVHKTKKAIEQGKFQYDEKDIIYNNFEDLEAWLAIKQVTHYDKDDLTLLDEIVEDILNEDIRNFKECLIKYKGVALKYSRSIKELLNTF